MSNRSRQHCKPNKESCIKLLTCRLVSDIAYRMVVCLELLLCFPLSSILCPCATKKSSCQIRPPRNQCQTTCTVTVETNKEITKDESTDVMDKKRIKSKAASSSSSSRNSRNMRDDEKIVMRSESTIVQYQARGRPDDYEDDYDNDYQRPRGRQYQYDDQGYSDPGYPEPHQRKQRRNSGYDPSCVDNTRLGYGYDNIPPTVRDKPVEPECPKPNRYEPNNYQDDVGYRSQNYNDDERSSSYGEGGPDPSCEKPFDPYSPENIKIKYGPDKMKYIDKNRNMLFENDKGFTLQSCKTPMVRCKLSLSRTQRLSRSQRWLPGLGKLNLQQIGFPDNWFGNNRIKDAYDSAKVKTKNPFKKIK